MLKSLRFTAVTIALILGLLSSAWAKYVGIEGTHYLIREGEVEGAGDNITPYPPPKWGNPVCFLKGTEWQLKQVSEGDPIYGWRVNWARLKSYVTGEVYWTIGDSGWLAANESLPLPDPPNYIEYAILEGDYVTLDDLWDPGMGFSLPRTSDVFLVLDEPKAPMDPAWVNVLRKSCRWARTKTTAQDAADILTSSLLQNGVYDYTQQYYTRNETDAGEDFYVSAFIENGMEGQCNDFGDFVVCLSTSVSAHEMRAQRTYSLTVAHGHPLQGPSPPWWAIQTTTLKPAPLTPGQEGQSYRFMYHQFGVFESSVWDGSSFFVGNGGMALGWSTSEYKSKLIKHYWKYDPDPKEEDDGPWLTVGPFIPTLKTGNPP